MLIRIREFRNGPRGRRLQEQLAGVFVALLIVAVLSASLAAALLWLPVEHVSIVYLIPVIVAALRWGIIPALFAGISGIAAAAFFFYAPYYDFRVHSPAQIVDIVLFIIVATITGRMAVAVREAEDSRASGKSARRTDRLGQSRIAYTACFDHGFRLNSRPGAGDRPGCAPVVAWSAWCATKPSGSTATSRTCLMPRASAATESARIGDGSIPRTSSTARWFASGGCLATVRSALAIADDLPLVYVDPSMIESALAQVIENAAKYSAPRTSIAIGAAQENGTIQIKVANEGEALASGEIEKIFERFYRSPRYAGAIPGSGLGLWIARALIEACGGRVQAVSSSHGTTFRIDLPVRAQPSSDEYADE